MVLFTLFVYNHIKPIPWDTWSERTVEKDDTIIQNDRSPSPKNDEENTQFRINDYVAKKQFL